MLQPIPVEALYPKRLDFNPRQEEPQQTLGNGRKPALERQTSKDTVLSTGSENSAPQTDLCYQEIVGQLERLVEDIDATQYGNHYSCAEIEATLLKRMKYKEERMMRSFLTDSGDSAVATVIRDRYRHLSLVIRAEVFDWVIQCAENLCITRGTVFLTFHLIDLFLLKWSVGAAQIRSKEFHLLGLTALYLATKYKEVEHHKPEVFVHCSDGLFSVQDMVECEKVILSTVGYEALTSVTPFDFALFYLESALPKVAESKRDAENWCLNDIKHYSNHSPSYSASAAYAHLLDSIVVILQALYFDVQFLKFRRSEVALLAVSYVLKRYFQVGCQDSQFKRTRRSLCEVNKLEADILNQLVDPTLKLAMKQYLQLGRTLKPKRHKRLVKLARHFAPEDLYLFQKHHDCILDCFCALAD